MRGAIGGSQWEPTSAVEHSFLGEPAHALGAQAWNGLGAHMAVGPRNFHCDKGTPSWRKPLVQGGQSHPPLSASRRLPTFQSGPNTGKLPARIKRSGILVTSPTLPP